MSGNTSWCWSTVKLKGKLKKNKLKWQTIEKCGAPCYCRKGSLKFTKDSAGIVTAEGSYSLDVSATSIRGKMTCTLDASPGWKKEN